MTEYRPVLERVRSSFPDSEMPFEGVLRRRDQRQRRRRIAAGVVGMAVFVAMVPIVTGGLSFHLTGTSVPGSSPPNQAKSAPVVSAIGPVPDTDFLLDLNTGEMTPLPEAIVGTEDLTDSYAASPDGSKLAYAGPGDDGKRQIFIANIDGTGVQQVTNGGKATAPAWSPDGSKIAYRGSVPGDEYVPNVFVLDLATGSSTQLTAYTWPQHAPNGPSFSADGSFIVYGVATEGSRPRDMIMMVPTLGGESMPFAAPGTDVHFSPDGSLLSSTCQMHPDAPISVCLSNADGTEARSISPNQVVAGGARWSPDGTRIAFWEFHGADDPSGGAAFVVDVATGDETYVAEGVHPVWLDDHTLILEHDRCPGPRSVSCGG